MTNLQLTVMIAAYCGCKETDNYSISETYCEQCTHLIDGGLIKPNDKSPAGFGYKFAITEKGKYWLDYVLDTPWPKEIKAFEIPERT